MNIWDGVVLLLVAGAASLALRHMGRQKKSGCTGNCGCCACVCSQREKEQ